MYADSLFNLLFSPIPSDQPVQSNIDKVSLLKKQQTGFELQPNKQSWNHKPDEIVLLTTTHCCSVYGI